MQAIYLSASDSSNEPKIIFYRNTLLSLFEETRAMGYLLHNALEEIRSGIRNKANMAER